MSLGQRSKSERSNRSSSLPQKKLLPKRLVSSFPFNLVTLWHHTTSLSHTLQNLCLGSAHEVVSGAGSGMFELTNQRRLGIIIWWTLQLASYVCFQKKKQKTPSKTTTAKIIMSFNSKFNKDVTSRRPLSFKTSCHGSTTRHRHNVRLQYWLKAHCLNSHDDVLSWIINPGFWQAFFCVKTKVWWWKLKK